MADVTVKKVDELEANFGGAFKLVRHGLDVSSFGIALIDLPPNLDQYPEHDHAHDGQEEVYTVLEGKATLDVGGEQFELEPGTFVRVGPAEKRKIITGDQSARILALGGTPGTAYEISADEQAAGAARLRSRVGPRYRRPRRARAGREPRPRAAPARRRWRARARALRSSAASASRSSAPLPRSVAARRRSWPTPTGSTSCPAWSRRSSRRSARSRSSSPTPAGRRPGAPLGIDTEQWQAAYRSLVLAPLALIEAVAPGMRERGWGRIVNVTSISTREPIAGLVLSNAHRLAAVGLFKTLSREFAADGVTLNSVGPGRIATDRIAELTGTPRRRARAHAAARHPGRPPRPPGRVRRRGRLPVLGAGLVPDRRQPDG